MDMAEPRASADGPLELPFDEALVAELIEELRAEHFAALLAVFERDLAARLDRLRSAIATGDNEVAQHLLHAMAGSAASVGAVSLAAVCRRGMAAGDLSAALAGHVEAVAATALAALRRRRAGQEQAA